MGAGGKGGRQRHRAQRLIQEAGTIFMGAGDGHGNGHVGGNQGGWWSTAMGFDEGMDDVIAVQ